MNFSQNFQEKIMITVQVHPFILISINVERKPFLIMDFVNYGNHDSLCICSPISFAGVKLETIIKVSKSRVHQNLINIKMMVIMWQWGSTPLIQQKGNPFWSFFFLHVKWSLTFSSVWGVNEMRDPDKFACCWLWCRLAL